MSAPFPVEVARVYGDWRGRPGAHLFVDRLWPRGVAKADFHPDAWLRNIAPSAGLRQWYHADIEGRWPEFRTRYLVELDAMPNVVADVLALCRKGPVTLLTATHDVERSATVVLRDHLLERLEGEA